MIELQSYGGKVDEAISFLQLSSLSATPRQLHQLGLHKPGAAPWPPETPPSKPPRQVSPPVEAFADAPDDVITIGSSRQISGDIACTPTQLTPTVNLMSGNFRKSDIRLSQAAGHLLLKILHMRVAICRNIVALQHEHPRNRLCPCCLTDQCNHYCHVSILRTSVMSSITENLFSCAGTRLPAESLAAVADLEEAISLAVSGAVSTIEQRQRLQAESDASRQQWERHARARGILKAAAEQVDAAGKYLFNSLCIIGFLCIDFPAGRKLEA